MLPANETPGASCAVIAAVAAVALALPTPSPAGYREDVGYAALQAELGAATPTGAAVVVSQVEGSVQVSGQYTWMPEVTLGEFAGKTITNVSGAPAGLYSGHASAVGQNFYGSVTSIAPAISTIAAYGVDQWLSADFLRANVNQGPASTTSRVANHSWIGDAGAANAEILRRLDWVVGNDDMLQVTGLGNGYGGAATSALLAGAFNGIAPGLSSGLHERGTLAIDADYTAGRVRPDLVLPAENTSLAAARLSSAVALLVQAGHANAALSTDPVEGNFYNRAGLLIRNSERSEVIKAALMAGADRVTRNSSSTNLARYRSAGYQAGNGLDTRYGAGQLNIRNSHHIVAAGEQNSAEDGGPGSGGASRGFDYDPAFGGADGTNTIANYILPVAATPQLLTAALVVNLEIDGGTQMNFGGNSTFRDLSLAVRDVSSGASPVTVVTSQSNLDNTEHVWLVIPTNTQYSLRVARVGSTAFNHDFAIAWQLLPDTDADGAHDGQDNCIGVANGPLLPDAGGNSQLDADGDGYGNACDGDLNNSGLVTSMDYNLLRGAFNTSDPVADLNGSGTVTSTDFNMLRAQLNAAPGPSAYAP